MFATLVETVRHRLRTYAAYRRAVAEIEAMSPQELAALRTYGSDLREAARREILHR